MGRLIAPVLVLALAAGPALAAKNPDLVHLETTLKADMVKSFKKQAPKLKITTVTCTIPKNGGVTTHCKAYFLVGKVKGYYPVTTKFKDLGGKLQWTAAAPKCMYQPATKKYVAC